MARLLNIAKEFLTKLESEQSTVVRQTTGEFEASFLKVNFMDIMSKLTQQGGFYRGSGGPTVDELAEEHYRLCSLWLVDKYDPNMSAIGTDIHRTFSPTWAVNRAMAETLVGQIAKKGGSDV